MPPGSGAVRKSAGASAIRDHQRHTAYAPGIAAGTRADAPADLPGLGLCGERAGGEIAHAAMLAPQVRAIDADGRGMLPTRPVLVQARFTGNYAVAAVGSRSDRL